MIKKTVKNIINPLINSPPDFLIIGAQKAGTTSIARYLEQHPQIIGNNSWKEVRYYDLPENYSQGWGWYLGNFPFKWQKGNRLTFDASPSYLYFPHIAKQIQEDFSEIKMIVILRNPVKRAYSGWRMYHSFQDNSLEHLSSIADYRGFSEAIEQELNGDLSNQANYPYHYLARGRYVEQLENYFQYFKRDTILVLQFEKLKTDLEIVLNQICDFLDIEHFSSKKFQQLQEEKYNVGKYETSDQDLAVMEKLIDYFQPFNKRLYQLLGCNYNW